MKTTQEGLSLIKKFEGCRLESYLCSANVLTIGYGHTAGVKDGDTITKKEAEDLLAEDIEEFEDYVNNLVEVELKPYEFDALIAWTFNLGPTNLKESTMLKVLNEGKYNEVPAQIRRWNKAAGQTLDGLIRRREAESLLFQGEEWHEV